MEAECIKLIGYFHNIGNKFHALQGKFLKQLKELILSSRNEKSVLCPTEAIHPNREYQEKLVEKNHQEFLVMINHPKVRVTVTKQTTQQKICHG